MKNELEDYLDVYNFENFTPDEYIINLERLDIISHEQLVGGLVYYSQKSYGKHTVIQWDGYKGEYLLELDGDRFWSNPFNINL